MDKLEIIKPDDWHVHFRDNDILKSVVPETSRHFGRAIVMPNLVPPILNGIDAIEDKERIQKAIPKKDHFLPLRTVNLTENTNKYELCESYKRNQTFAAKLYPAGATTNSDSGVKDIKKIMPVLETMSEIGMPLLIHGEVTDKKIDIFDREKIFIDQNLDFICKELPELKITLEHITTQEATNYINEGNKRLYLNFGHTLGHAIEFATTLDGEETLRHCEAVALGMLAIFRISVELGHLDKDKITWLEGILNKFNLPTSYSAGNLNIDRESLVDMCMALVVRDKKRKFDGLRLIILSEIREPYIHKTSDLELLRLGFNEVISD